MKARTFFSALVFSTGFSTLAMAQVTGTVTLDGKAPVLPPINVAAVPACAKHGGTIPNETVVVSDKGGIANVVVSIKKEEGQDLPGEAPKDAAVLDQKDCQYAPHVVAVMAGQDLVVKNSDAFLHNVHSQPELNDPKNFAQPMADPKGKKIPTAKAEYYRVKCDVHPWMSAWVAVIDNPYFAVTDKDGNFTLPKGLPNGDYTLVAWHEKFDKQETKIKVVNGKAEAKIVYKAAGADAGKALQNLMPAGVKLAVDPTAPCCQVPSVKAVVSAQSK